jgi:hypothetical protein
VTLYVDGTQVVNEEAPDGKGKCSALGIITACDFGCTAFSVSENHCHEVVTHVDAPIWERWVMGPCPDSDGQGIVNGSICQRCAGTGKVRYYEDGFVGDERNRQHPKEAKGIQPIVCPDCEYEMKSEWKVCPMCGVRRLEDSRPRVADRLMFTN